MEPELTNGGSRGLFRKVRPFLSTSTVLPLVVIAVAFGVLAYRSYQLSERMEQGVNTLAIQYVGYAADISARRVDAAVRSEISNAAEAWLRIERESGEPTSGGMQRWIDEKAWIVSVIYVPDADPTDSLFVTELSESGRSASRRLNFQFYTASGSVQFTYDAERLVSRVAPAELSKQPDSLRLPGGVTFQQEGQVRLIKAGSSAPSLRRTPGGFAADVPLAEPLKDFAVRASVQTGYLGRGWESQKVISGVLTATALILAMVGVLLAVRGIRREGEAMQLRAALIANVSHELRTPLSMIRLGAETLTHGDKLTARERTDILQSILRESAHLSHLVENVLDVARLQKSSKPLVFAPVYPDEIVSYVIDNYEGWLHSKGFKLELDIDEMIDEQMWDREAVSRALLNLIDNAAKYSTDSKDIRISLVQRDDFVVLSVEDHGIGVPAREVPRIFEPYYRSQFSDTETRRGAGLGLTLVKQIVESHGGRIEVESTEGRGSVFRLIFPKTQQPEPENVPRMSLSRV